MGNFKGCISKLEDFYVKGLVEKNTTGAYDYELCNRLCHLSSDDIKVKYFNEIHEDFYKSRVLCSFKDELKKIENIDCLYWNSKKIDVLKTIKDDQLILSYYKRCIGSMKKDIISVLNDDYLKELYIKDFDTEGQCRIIESFKTDELLKKYAVMPEYSNYRSLLISKIKDVDFIYNYYKGNDSMRFRINLIQKIKDEKLKYSLIEDLQPCMYKEILKSNSVKTKEDILGNIDLDDVMLDVDQDITIGLELEACGSQAHDVLLSDSILKNWVIKQDVSVHDGLEISSPILRFDENSLKQLYYVCSLMSQNGFYTDETCGGHIHLGFNYFENKNEFNRFLSLYASVEDILYVISNKSGSNIRENVSRYAKALDKDIKSDLITNVNVNRISNLKQYVKVVQDSQHDRYYGLNMKNIYSSGKNTLEFRMPNGEIDFNELIINIRLFAKLLESIKDRNLTDEKLDMFYSITEDNLDESERLGLLLDLLFDSEFEKQSYYERYANNSKSLGYKAH